MNDALNSRGEELAMLSPPEHRQMSTVMRCFIKGMRLQSWRTRRFRRGVTLIEMVIVLAIVTLMVGVAVPNFNRLKRQQEMRSAVRNLVAELHKIRMTGITGKLNTQNNNVASTVSLDDENSQSYIQSGLRITNNHTIEFFGDTDTRSNNGSDLLKVLDFNEKYPQAQIAIEAPSIGSEIRFERNSTRDPNSPSTIRIASGATDTSTEITISLAGLPRVR